MFLFQRFANLPSSLWRGIIAASLAVLLTVALEATCTLQVRMLCATPTGKNLYYSALCRNIWNNILLGPLTYHLAIAYVCTESKPGNAIVERSCAVLGIILVEGGMYYVLHKAFHEYRSLYWIHRYHHKFHHIVLPSSANAVSTAEYVIAYMMPLVLGVHLTGADEISTFLGSAIVAIANLLIHTPSLEGNRESNLFWALVSTHDHLEHHRTSTSDYAAPVLHIDRIRKSIPSLFQ
jgi:sterol desaturase/sphingolipid hydroxylase (fatty acid hydroxylase superfamily)